MVPKSNFRMGCGVRHRVSAMSGHSGRDRKRHRFIRIAVGLLSLVLPGASGCEPFGHGHGEHDHDEYMFESNGMHYVAGGHHE